VNGVPDDRTYRSPSPPPPGDQAIVSYPSLSYVGINQFDYHLTLVDARQDVAESTASPSAGRRSSSST